MDTVTLAVAKKYTDSSLAGVGALKGVPCQIQSITSITGGSRVTFLWVDNDNVSHTQTMDVMNGATGATGETGVGISSVEVDASNHVIVTYTDGNEVDAGEIDVSDKANKVTGATNGHFASLTSGGDLQDSGKKASDFIEKSESEIVFTGTLEEYEAAKSSIPNGAAVLIKGNNDLTSLRNIAIQSIGIEYARANDTSYYIARIPKYAVNGMRITPKVRLTSANGEVGTSSADYTSALTYAKTHGSIFTINAGLFKISGDYAPHGRTIVDGVAVTDEDAGETVSSVSEHEVYPLCIDENGNLSTPYDRDVPDATMIAGGVMQAVTGWGTVVQNYVETDSSVFDEQKHTGDYIRQGIGQYQNGDYFVLTTDGVKTTEVNETGMTYEEIAAICIAKGVKFFYSLDGGGSTETVIGDRQINLIYENTSGRVVPTVIEFVLEASE